MKANFFTLIRSGIIVLYLGLAASTAFASPGRSPVFSLQDDKGKKEKKQAEEKEVPEIKDKKAPAEQHYDRYDKRKRRVNRPVRC